MGFKLNELPEKWREQAKSQIGDTSLPPNLEQAVDGEPLEAKKDKRFTSPVYLVCTHYRTREADIDNLTCKYCTDELVKRGVLQDDRPAFVKGVKHHQIHVKTQEEEKTIIELWEV